MGVSWSCEVAAWRTCVLVEEVLACVVALECRACCSLGFQNR